MKKRSLLILTNLIIVLTLLFSLSSTKVYALYNQSYSAGTTNGINTTKDVTDSKTYYSKAGYVTFSNMDPTRGMLSSYLNSDVLFFPTHGNVSSIAFANSGIKTGASSGNDIGLNTLNFTTTNTILVTYASCNSAGENNANNLNSITHQTVQRGAETAVGWRNAIDSLPATNWAFNYHYKLGFGQSVQNAVDYANSFTYDDARVRQVTIVGNTNTKIGTWHGLKSPEIVEVDDREMIAKYNLNINNRKATDNLNKAVSLIKGVYPNLDLNNYKIMETTGAIVTDLNTGKSEMLYEYIDLQLKIGDFNTLAAYTIAIKDGEIKAIYDNNIDIVKQENALNSKEEFRVNISDDELNQFKQQAKNKIDRQYVFSNNNIRTQNDIKTSYFYNIETGKKYVRVTVPSMAGNGAIAYEYVDYEI
ncbi:MAG: hypothetical protein FWF46_05980 [Oscillospiraceae bacterium]|nr:hypothetical protein [Oscillospiraceae bacterium]